MKRFSLPHKNEFRRILSSRHFRSALCLSLIICTLLYFLIVAFVVRQLSGTMTDKAVGTANTVCADMQGTLSAIQSNAVSISSLKSVKEIVNLDRPSLDDYVDVSSDLSAFSSTIDYKSVDIFLLKPRRVYVSRMGMYEFSDYPGRDLIALIEENSIMGAKWLVGRNYVRYYSEQYPIPVATYLLRLPIDSSNGTGFIAIHLSFETVSRLIEARRQPGYGILLSYQGVPIYSTQKDFQSTGTFFDDANAYASSHGFLSACSGEGTDVQCAVLVPRSVLWDSLMPFVPAAVIVYLTILVLSAVGAYIYSASLLRPVDQLVRKAGSLVIDPGNEYDQLNSAFDRLSDEVSRIQRQMQRDLPLVRDQIILTLLGNYTEVPEDYSEQGISFPFDSFAVISASLPERVNEPGNTLREPLKMIVRRHSLEKLAPLGRVYSAFGESQNVLFLINMDYTPGIKKELQRLCGELSRELREAIAMPVLLSAGIGPKGVRVPYQAYLQARRAMPFLDEEETVGLSGPGEYALPVDPSLIRGLAQCVLDRDAPALRERLSQCFDALTPGPEDAVQLRRFSQLILYHVQARLFELDIPSQTAPFTAAMKKLDSAPSCDACLSILLGWCSAQIDAGSALPEKSYQYVREAIAFIERHYGENISVPQIAQQVAVNPVYLNKLFKLATGKTISEYLNYYRIEMGKELLLREDATVNAVASGLGYNDVRSFIRFFKKFTGLTPKDFRRQNLPETGSNSTDDGKDSD
ncbi:MAG TPA: AraC family transcriptional regulator [Candidatus Caccousia stercoris]|uniref:AraC family transcriptional regulator n=1 Tax=Candidatus Caccousia stercoris TaxID=2840723 RepID=A0A9D1K1Z7_9FIRM|nr:AraC family transcriptional regulator [Candidatus Caccousia stercoris]